MPSNFYSVITSGRQAGGLFVKVVYPQYWGVEDWNFEYNGEVIASQDYSDPYAEAFCYIPYSKESVIIQGSLSFTAYAPSDSYGGGGGSRDLYWNVFDGALQLSALRIDGTDSVDIILGGSGRDVIKSAAGDDWIDAGGGDDVIVGGSGNDIIDGGVGDDVMIGSIGNDAYIIDSIYDDIIEEAGGGSDGVQSYINYTLLSNVENLLLLGAGSINGTGNDTNNVIKGNNGSNTIDGRIGADYMQGFAGNDIYLVDNTNDRVMEAVSGGKDVVKTSVSFALASGQEIEGLYASDIAGKNLIDLTGNEYANDVRGNAGANTIRGGLGKDTLDGANGYDTVSYADKSVAVVIALNNNIKTTVTVNGAAEDTIVNFENVLGGSGNDRITGDARINVLNGGLGADSLTGLAGKDTFVFSTALGATNVDRITDFSAVDDTIQLSKAVFTALSAGTLTANAFKDLSVSGAKVDADDRILYNKATGALSYDADGSGTKAAVQFATIDTKVALTAADFFVV